MIAAVVAMVTWLAAAAPEPPAARPVDDGGARAAGGLTVEQAVAVALQRNRDAIAARLDIEASELDIVAARIYPNPLAQYGIEAKSAHFAGLHRLPGEATLETYANTSRQHPDHDTETWSPAR